MSTAPCPFCGTAIAVSSFYCSSCRKNLPVDPAGRPALDPQYSATIAPPAGWFCQTCGTVGRPRRYEKTNLIVEIALWFVAIVLLITSSIWLVFVPAAGYTLYRLVTAYKGCGTCQSRAIIPAASPKARQAIS
jgi:hypothetical protein